MTAPAPGSSAELRSTVQWIGLLAAPILALLTYLLLPESYHAAGGQAVLFPPAGRATAAVAVWMATWWITEAIPVYATGLLPLALLPLTGAATIRNAASPYGHELIFLFMGGFIIALAMQRWDLHRRVAFNALRLVGTRPDHIVGMFMLVTAGLSMWVSNTAITIMMLPIAVSVIDLVVPGNGTGMGERRGVPQGEGRNFALCLLLGIAYAASIGGIGTLIGTPPNLFLASFIEEHLGLEISFVRWMGVGLPLVAVFLPVVWLVLTRSQYPIRMRTIEGGAELAREARDRLGPMKRGEWTTLAVFLATATMWLFRPLLTRIEIAGLKPLGGLTDPGIAMVGALALFLIPVDIGRRVFAMDWKTAVRLPWGLLILFGGGLSLAAAIDANGVSEFLGNQVGALAGIPSILVVMIVTAMMIYLTEITSNTATTAALVPILAALAPGLGLHPFLLIVPAAIAASCAFMLPVATPPNAIVFGTGYVTIPQMCRAGWWLNLIGIVLITLLTYAVAIPLLGL
jgi:sodium-dependent dicarboxylate transporter 2/3/5